MYTLMQSNITHDTCFTHNLLFTCFASCRNVLIILCCLCEEEEPTMSFKLIEKFVCNHNIILRHDQLE